MKKNTLYCKTGLLVIPNPDEFPNSKAYIKIEKTYWYAKMVKLFNMNVILKIIGTTALSVLALLGFSMLYLDIISEIELSLYEGIGVCFFISACGIGALKMWKII